MSKLLWIVSLIVVILLGLASLFIVYNTVRLTLFMRREEIIIMKLVGATNWFVRGPFVVEGFLEGLLASTMSVVVLLLSYNFILTKLAELIPFFNSTITVEQLFKLSIKLFMMGIVLGVSGSLISLRDINEFFSNLLQTVKAIQELRIYPYFLKLCMCFYLQKVKRRRLL